MRILKWSLALMTVLLACSVAVFADTPSSISANFNGTAITGGDYIWFSSVLKASGLGSKAVTIFVRNSSITFSANGTAYAVPVPDANVTFAEEWQKTCEAFAAKVNAKRRRGPSAR